MILGLVMPGAALSFLFKDGLGTSAVYSTLKVEPYALL